MKGASGTCECPIPWLGLPASTAGAQVQSLLRELMSHMLLSIEKKIITYFEKKKGKIFAF